MNLLVAAALVLSAPGGITVTAPDEVHVDGWIPVSGTVRVEPGERRPVRLEEQVGDRWHVMERTRARRDGRFALTQRSGPIPQVRTFRVVAPPSGALARVASRPFDVRMYVDIPEAS